MENDSNSTPKIKLIKQPTDRNDNINNCNTAESKDKNKISKENNNSPNKDEIKKEKKKEDVNDDSVVQVRAIKRMNSIKLYQKHNKEKERRNSLEKEIDKDTKDKSGDIINVPEVTGKNKAIKIAKNVKQKKVEFLPNFVKVIYVESYKKFNAENTCKDPFENMEIVNGQLSIKTNNNGDEADGKTKVLCSCFIY